MTQESFLLTAEPEVTEPELELPEIGSLVSVKGRHGSWKVNRIWRKADKIAVVVRELISEDKCGYSDHFIRPENIVTDRPKRRQA